MAGTKAKGGKKNRKLGRNKNACAAYVREERQKKNKIRRMRRHLRALRHAHDAQGRSLFKQLTGSLDAIDT